MIAQRRHNLRSFPSDSRPLKVSITFIFIYLSLDATKFKEAFEAAQKFNLAAKEGKDDELVFAPTVEDVEEQPDPADDPEQNKTAGGDDAAGGDDE